MQRVAVASETAIVALCDPAVALPEGLDQDALVRTLEPLARRGEVFYLIADDPLQFELGIVAAGAPPVELTRHFEPSGGTFGLELPSGQLGAYGWTREGQPTMAGSASCTAGALVLTAFVSRPFDGARHSEDMTALLGADWPFMQRVDKLALLGCLPILAVALAMFAQKWRWLAYLVPLAVLAWAPHWILRLSSRYKAAERKTAAYAKQWPAVVVSIAAAAERGRPGGFVRI